MVFIGIKNVPGKTRKKIKFLSILRHLWAKLRKSSKYINFYFQT